MFTAAVMGCVWQLVIKENDDDDDDDDEVRQHTMSGGLKWLVRCVSKNDTDVAHYNFNAHQSI